MFLAQHQHVLPQQVIQRLQQFAHRAGPASQRGTAQLHALAAVYLRLTVMRRVFRAHRRDDARQQSSFGRCVSITLKALLISSNCSAISSCRMLMRSSASHTWRCVFSRNFLEFLPNCIRCSLATSAFRRLISLVYTATRCKSRSLYSAILRRVICCALSRAFSSGYELSIASLYSRLYAYSRAFRPLRMGPVNAFQQHGQLRWHSVACHRPDEASPLQALSEQAQTITGSLQHFYHVAATTAEVKQTTAKRVIQ